MYLLCTPLGTDHNSAPGCNSPWLLVGILAWIGLTSFVRAFDVWKIFQTIYIIQAMFNIAATIITNSIIFREIRRHEKRIAQVQHLAPNADEIRKARGKKRAKTIILMMSLVILCYLPLMVLLLGYKVPSVDPVKWQYAFLCCRIFSK